MHINTAFDRNIYIKITLDSVQQFASARFKMFKTALVLVVLVGAVTSRAGKRQRDYENDYFGAESNNFEHYEAAASNQEVAKSGGGRGGNGGSGDGKQGFSAGSGLRSIAQGSAEQAKNAVQNQNAAASQAAYIAKNTLAQAAAAASATAQAALAGKQVILQGVEQQVQEAKTGLDGENMQLQQAQRSATAAQQAAQQAAAQVNVLTAAMNAAQATSDHAQQSSSEAAGELAAQVAMVGAAKQRLQTLLEQLHGIRIDFEATQAAAQKAQAAAQAAQANAAAAAAEAAIGFENANHDAASGGDKAALAAELYDANNYNLYHYQ